MALNFGKLNFAVSFNPQTAFPLDARSYFESYALAVEAAGKAEEAGSTTSVYYYGQTLVVSENSKAITGGVIREHFREYRRKAKLNEKVTMHTLRHCFAPLRIAAANFDICGVRPKNHLLFSRYHSNYIEFQKSSCFFKSCICFFHYSLF